MKSASLLEYFVLLTPLLGGTVVHYLSGLVLSLLLQCGHRASLRSFLRGGWGKETVSYQCLCLSEHLLTRTQAVCVLFHQYWGTDIILVSIFWASLPAAVLLPLAHLPAHEASPGACFLPKDAVWIPINMAIFVTYSSGPWVCDSGVQSLSGSQR